MPTTVDTLLTVYKVVDNYTQPVQRMAAATAHFGASVSSVLGKISALAGFAGFGLLTKSAISHALAIEKLTATFQALSGSTDIAAQKMQFLQTFAKTSIGEFEDLAEAGKLLEASGVTMERILPTLTNVAAAFGGTREEILELASAFGRLTSGQFGESMEIFRRFGISAADLMAEGIKISGGGQITSSVLEVFAAIEKVADRKFGRIGEIMEDNVGVKLSNVKDAFNQMLVVFGQKFFPIISKVADKLIQLFDFFKESGFIQEFANQITRAFENMGKLLGGEGGFQRVMFVTLSFLTKLPGALFHVAEWLKGFFVSTKDMIESWINGVIGYLNKVLRGLEFVVNYMTYGMMNYKAPQIPDIDQIRKNIGGFLDDHVLSGFFKDVFLDADRMQKAFGAFQNKPAGAGLPDKKNFEFLNGQTKVMQDIEKNTGRTAMATEKQLDLRRVALGGGPLGQMGVTPVELFAGTGRRASGSVRVKFDKDGKVSEAMEGVVNDIIGEMIRAGQLQVGR